MLSENYYASLVCLNEMGAVWIRDAKYQTILLPGFTFEQVKGVICEKSMIGIALDTYDKSSAHRFNHLRSDMADFGFTLSYDKWDLAILDFYCAVESYRKQLTDGIVLDMENVKSYCIDDADNDGCRIIKRKSSRTRTNVVVDFDKTSSKLCSVVYRVEHKDWLSLDKYSKLLCFEAYGDIEDLRVEVELHLADRNEQVQISINDDTQSFRIPLVHFTSSVDAWREVKEVCLLFRKKYLKEKSTIVIENLRLEG